MKQENVILSEQTKLQHKLTAMLNVCMTVFVLGMFGIFPLYYQNGYFDMGEAKYSFVKYFSMGVFGTAILIWIIKMAADIFRHSNGKTGWNFNRTRMSVTDWFMIGYGIVVLISYLLTPYKEQAFWGYPGWYMGLYSQFLFLAIYFFISRYLKWENFFLIPILGSSAIVFLLAILHRFRIDPLGMYEGVSESQHIFFLTTIGQATWYSSYLCIIFPIGLFLFWYTGNKIFRAILAIYVCLGFATIVTQNSDSAFIATALMLLVLFCSSFRKNEKGKRFMEIVLLGLFSFKMIGWLQLAFPQRVVELEKLSLFFSQSNVITCLLFLLTAGYLIYLSAEKKGKFQIANYKEIPKVVLILAVLSVPLVIGLIFLTTTNRLPGAFNFLKEINYFHFDTNWGSGRGFSWKICMEIFAEYPLVNKIFGCGPDCFAAYSYEYYREILVSKWGDSVLTNAHNEWLTSLLFFGVTGLISYLGIFISQIVLGIKQQIQNPAGIVIVMCIAAYIGHNFFCYQQIVCTPLIFAIMGIGEGFRRREGNAL